MANELHVQNVFLPGKISVRTNIIYKAYVNVTWIKNYQLLSNNLYDDFSGKNSPA